MAFTSACSSASDPSTDKPHVLLVTLDTCRADRIGAYGNQRIDTPHLDRLATTGALFENAVAPVPSTLPAHTSLMTAQYPALHGVHDNGIYFLEPGSITLAERLQEAGYSTAAFVSAYVLDEHFGIGQGFEVYDDAMDLPLKAMKKEWLEQEKDPDRQQWLRHLAAPYQRRAEATTRAAIDWLENAPQQPLFLWVHYFDPHMPYDAPEPYGAQYDPDYEGPADGQEGTFWKLYRSSQWSDRDQQHMIARYDGEIAYMDHWFGELQKAFEDLGLADNLFTAVVGDHGESFGEHQIVWEHNAVLYESVVHVPLLLHHSTIPAGRRIDKVVRALDVAPTLLDYLGLQPLASSHGQSLRPLLRAGAANVDFDEGVLLQALRERQVTPSESSLIGFREGNHKLILTLDRNEQVVARELFDLERDPREKESYLDQYLSAARSLESRALSVYRTLHRMRGALPLQAVDPVTEDALRALGYVE